MRRSRSYSSLRRKDYETQSEEEEGDGSSVINAYDTAESYSILKWQSANKNRKPMVNFAAASVLVGTPIEAMEIISMIFFIDAMLTEHIFNDDISFRSLSLLKLNSKYFGGKPPPCGWGINKFSEILGKK